MTVTVWSLSPQDQFRFRDWGDDDDTVVFSRRSGDTHLLTPLPLALLAILGQADASTGTLAAGLGEVLGGMSQEEAMELIETTLIQLKDMGLVSSVSS